MDIVPATRLAYTDHFANEKGEIVHATRYGMSKDFPMEMTAAVTFLERNGRTTMTLQYRGIP